MSSKLPLLPELPDEKESCKAVLPGRFPPWLHRSLPPGGSLWKTHDVLNTYRLPTVCEEAKCPNLPECYSQKTATFLAMGSACTRNCGFCSIDFSKTPKPLEEDEPHRLAHSVKMLGLKHVVITMVARDDLSDGGASHLAKIILEVRKINSQVSIEVLTSDFAGNENALDCVIEARPEIFNHNIETVRELTPRVRHKATYERTLSILRYVKRSSHGMHIKSGLMLGLGETRLQVHETLQDLNEAGCGIITMGHYLQPSQQKLRVKSFVTPEEFEAYAAYARSLGVAHVYAGPFVRSSYNAASLYETIRRKENESI